MEPTAEVLNEMKRYKLDMRGFSECCWNTDDKHCIYTLRPLRRCECNVAIIALKNNFKSLLEWGAMN